MRPGDMVLYTYSSFVPDSRWKTEVVLILKEIHRISSDTKIYMILDLSGKQKMVSGNSIKPL